MGTWGSGGVLALYDVVYFRDMDAFLKTTIDLGQILIHFYDDDLRLI